MNPHRLYRSQNEKMIAGVCGGLGEYLGIDPTIVRLIFVLLTLVGGHGILLYIILLLITPMQPVQPIQPPAEAAPPQG